jgi:hypothetical protein
MEKIRIAADELRVESFVVDGEADERGTVHANEDVFSVGDTCSGPLRCFCQATVNGC